MNAKYYDDPSREEQKRLYATQAGFGRCVGSLFYCMIYQKGSDACRDSDFDLNRDAGYNSGLSQSLLKFARQVIAG